MVSVPALLEVETYATVHQMVSRVEAQLDGAPSLTDLMRALFPCGSITGAPKIAAMQAIRALLWDVTDMGEPQWGRVHLLDGLAPGMRSFAIAKDPECKACGSGG